MSAFDFKIVVRSYKRAEMFLKMTYNMLYLDTEIDLKKRLYIFVANEEEKKDYERVLGGKPYAEIVIAEIGGHKAIEHAHKYFPIGTPLVFMDDDLEYFFEFKDTPSKENFVKNSTYLRVYLIDGFNTLHELDAKIFTFSFYKNDFYIKDKPFKEFRPYNIPGGFFGCINHPDIVTDHAHLDDIHRTCRYIENHGGTVIYNWCGFETKTGLNEGGMQASGDRGNDETRMQMMKEMCHKIYEIPYVKKYCKEPAIAHTGMWELKLKPVSSIRKLRNFTNHRYTNYFQQTPDQNKVSLDEFV